MGKARTVLGQHQEAVEALECCVEHTPDVIPYWRELAMAYVRMERYAEAQEICRKRLRKGLAWHLILAHIECRRGNLDEAASLTQQALDAMGVPSAFIEVRRHYCNRMSHQELIAYVEEMVSCIPDTPWPHWILARLHSVLDHTSEVQEELREALRLDPTLAAAVERDAYLQAFTSSICREWEMFREKNP